MLRAIGAAMLALPLVVMRVSPVAAQGTDAPGSVGTIIVAHGGGPEWNARVETMAKAARLPGPVGVSFLMGPAAKASRFQDVARALVAQGARRIVVVPLLVSSHSGHYEQIRYLVGETDSLDQQMLHHLHMSGIERPEPRVPVRLTRAVDDAPEVADVLADRAMTLASDPRNQTLFLVGHGPNSAEDHAAWMSNLRRVADRVRERTGFRSVLVDLVRDDAPAPVRAEAVRRVRELIELQHQLTGKQVVVVPVLVSTGKVSTEKLPRDLAGLPIEYTSEGLLPHEGMAQWLEARVRDATEGSVTSLR